MTRRDVKFLVKYNEIKLQIIFVETTEIFLTVTICIQHVLTDLTLEIACVFMQLFIIVFVKT